MGTTGGPKTGLSREAEARGRIKALSRQQLWRQVAELLNERQLDGFAFGAAIHAAAAATAWHAAVHFLEGMASAGIVPQSISHNSAAVACGKAHWSRGLLLAENAALGRLLSTFGEDWRASLRVLRSMPSQELRPDVVNYTCGLQSAGAANWARALHLLWAGDQRNVVSFGVMKVFRWPLALHVLDTMPAWSTQPNVLSFSSLEWEWPIALSLLASMTLRSVQPNVVNFSSCIAACEKAGWQIAVALLADMRGARVLPNAISYNSAISCCRGHLALALELLEEMKQAKLEPTAASYSSCITSCERGGHWQMALHLLGCLPNPVSLSACMSACEKCSQWQVGLALLADADSVVAFNCGLAACEKGANLGLGLSLVQAMAQRRLTPDVISFNSLLHGCAFHGRWTWALGLLGVLEMQVNQISLNSATSACAAASQWLKPLELLLSSQRRSLQASEIYWGGCLEACQRASRWQSCLLALDSAGIAGLCSCITACDAAGRPQARLLASLGSELEKVLRC
ncbi:unnamed protein product [Effrenium voratum]|nr:unnamed protein product [Effrenium voratum]